jgi:hypothetical protein
MPTDQLSNPRSGLRHQRILTAFVPDDSGSGSENFFPDLPIQRKEVPLALPQLVAIDDCALSSCHVVQDATLDKRIYAGVAEQDQ